MSMRTARTRLVVLFEHEIRDAARAVARVVKAAEAANAGDEEQGRQLGVLMYEALGLCSTALGGADEEGCMVTLTRAEAFGFEVAAEVEPEKVVRSPWRPMTEHPPDGYSKRVLVRASGGTIVEMGRWDYRGWAIWSNQYGFEEVGAVDAHEWAYIPGEEPDGQA